MNTEAILSFLKSYPELIAICLGTIGSWTAASVLEYFLPEKWSGRATKQATVAANVLCGTTISYTLWRVLDEADPRVFNFTVSLICGLSSPFTYVPVSKLAAKYLPWLTWAQPVYPPPLPPPTKS